MSLTRVTLAVEDALSDAVATKILESCGFEIKARLKQQGNTYLKQKAPELNRAAARNRPVFLLTDLDSPKNCPLDLIQSWIKGLPKPGFFFRVAVMEVESWVLADRGAVARFLSVPASQIPQQTDDVADPKERIVSLAQKSRSRTIREALVPAPESTAPVGNEYNARLIEFVRESWDLERAASVSPSLKRTLERLRQSS